MDLNLIRFRPRKSPHRKICVVVELSVLYVGANSCESLPFAQTLGPSDGLWAPLSELFGSLHLLLQVDYSTSVI